MLLHTIPLHHINLGVGKDICIRELASLISGVAGYDGEIRWDTSKPDGMPRKLLDVSRLQSLGWQYTTELTAGLRQTYQWFVENEANVRK